MQLDPSQAAAVDLMVTAPFGVVTGGPGVGKSTTLRAALDRLDAEGRTYALCSPTGKAAKRMCEATGREASTIHRLLKFHPAHGWFHNASNPLTVDVVFVDEASMVDVELAATLFDAITDRTRCILIGDANQLPSVGPGRVLADLVESEAVPVARLTTVHRAAAESWVCRNAPRVLVGEPLELAATRDFIFHEAGTAEDAARIVGEICLKAPPEMGVPQVLSPQRTVACGVEALNSELQRLLNPPVEGGELRVGDSLFRRGDRVIQTKNDYKIVALDGTAGVFNGEVGEVTSVSSEGLVVDFGDRSIPYNKGQVMGLDLAYALTVHKSQGSEFPWVVMVCHSSHTHMLTRQLFYTGITRAKKGVILVGDHKGLGAALNGRMPPHRNTSLVEQMAEHGAVRFERIESAAKDEGKPASAPGEELVW